MTNRVYIVQCLCPKRHCILAFTGDMDKDLFDQYPNEATKVLCDKLAETVDAAIAGMPMKAATSNIDEPLDLDCGINPWCGICGARRGTWTFEVGFTRWSSMEEARPHLEHAAMDQLITRGLIELHKAKASAN